MAWLRLAHLAPLVSPHGPGCRLLCLTHAWRQHYKALDPRPPGTFSSKHAADGALPCRIRCSRDARYGRLHDFSPEDIAVKVSTKLTGSLLMAARTIRGMRRAGVGWRHCLRHLRCRSLAVDPALALAPTQPPMLAPSMRPELETAGIRAGVLRGGRPVGSRRARERNRAMARRPPRSDAQSLRTSERGSRPHRSMCSPNGWSAESTPARLATASGGTGPHKSRMVAALSVQAFSPLM